jgi:PAS domain S-box-containing protein
MSKKQYLDEQIAIRLQYWIGKMLLLGIIFFPFIGIADYFVTPENLIRFTGYRLAISCLLLVVYCLNKRKRGIRYQHTLITVATVLSALVIEIMILQFGGHVSPYYAGLNLLIIAALGLIPYGFSLSLSLSIAIYSIYLAPIFIFDTITNPSTFIANNVFMICTFVLVLSWRILSQKSMLNELSHQYDLVQDKQKLEAYSMQLELLLKELNKSEQWHRSLFDSATDGIIVLDRKGVIMNANDNACVMHGYSKDDLIGAHITLLENDGQREKMAERMLRILAGESLVFETTHNKKDGSPLHLEISSKAIVIDDELYIQSFYRDVTEKKKLREHLIQSQKMESIGVLAGGIAHDFNNILTAILGHTEVLRLNTSLDSKSLRSLQVIEEVSLKAGGMISKLLGFARKSTYEMLPLNVNNVIMDTVKLIERMLGAGIKLNIDLDDRLPFIHGDINQLEQVMMNLLVNARDAMPKGGHIHIATRYREVTDGMTYVPHYVQPGHYALITVVDTGTGMPDQVVQKIFEPFFTTKERGKGTGLGLSMVYGAVKEHGGYIDVQSQVGCGSTFTIYLPVPTMAVSWPVKAHETPTKRKEVILYVDDQEDALSAVQEILAHQGYTVLSASDPARALALFKEKRHEIALVITDMVMPEINGMELIQQISALNPELKILAVSGDMNIIADKDNIRDIAGFLRKPFESRVLLSTVRRILDTTPNSSAPVNR